MIEQETWTDAKVRLPETKEESEDGMSRSKQVLCHIKGNNEYTTLYLFIDEGEFLWSATGEFLCEGAELDVVAYWLPLPPLLNK